MTQTIKPTLLFIHGAGGGGWEWKYWQTYFTSLGWNTFSPTLTGTPLVDIHKRTFTHYCNQVQAMLDTVGPVFLIGASMGGMIAQTLGVKNNLKGIILLNSVPPLSAAPGFFTHGSKDIPDIIRWSTQSSLSDTKACMPEADEQTMLWAHARWRDESGHVLREIRQGIQIQRTAITCPVLVLCGKDDNDIPEAVSMQIAKFYQADFMSFAKVSHVGALLGDRWQDVAHATKSWIEQINSR